MGVLQGPIIGCGCVGRGVDKCFIGALGLGGCIVDRG